MRTIALINQKGGVGKTTIALHLATAFWQHGRNALVLDLDPQASASEWHDARAGEFPAVTSIQPSRLEKVVAEARSIGQIYAGVRVVAFGEGSSKALAH